MSTELSKNKEKRRRESSESNKSFVKNVTSRVSGLLPATIVNWFSNSSPSNTNGSAAVADVTDSSTEDEAPESPVIIQPPAKRMRYTSPGNLNQSMAVEMRCISTNTDSLDDVCNTVNSPVIRSTYRREKNYHSSPISTSNISTNTVQDSSFFKSQHTLSGIGQSTAKKRKSLFDNPNDDSYSKTYTSSGRNARDPYFKSALLSSPFYVGRTMYGGAASSYMTQPNIKQRNISLTDETSNNDSVTISHSARRVMDLLEHYSSPLSEAKRLPQISRSPATQNLHNSFEHSVNPCTPKVSSYKTTELYVPTVANILSIKRRSRLMDTTNAARQLIASHSSSSEFLPYFGTKQGDSGKGASGDKLTTKVKSRLTRINRQRNLEVEDNASDIVNLPTVVLQIDKDNLPTFKLGGSSISQSFKPFSIQTPVIIAPDSLKRATDTNKSVNSKINNIERDKQLQVNDDYAFASPDKVLKEANNIASPPPKFNFGSPERNLDNSQEVKKKYENVVSVISIQNDNKLPILKSSEWKCLDCWVMNKTDVNNCISCGGKKPIEVEDTNKCLSCNAFSSKTKCDKCVDSEEKTNNKQFVAKETKGLMPVLSDNNVTKEDMADKCEPCTEINPTKTPPTITVSYCKDNIESEWKCNDCWIKNKITLDKCAACGGQKPGSKLSNSSSDNVPLPNSNQQLAVQKTTDKIFKNIAQAQKDKWECTLCLVRNEGNRATCICCESDRPGSVQESHKKSFNFHQPSEITFKFGIQPNNQEKLKKKEVIETDKSNMTAESETNNNVLPKTPAFNFGVPQKKTNDQSEISMEKSVEPPKLNFGFGVPKLDLVTPTTSTVFGKSSKLPEKSNNSDETGKPQDVPQVFAPLKCDEIPKKSEGLFKSPVSSQNSQGILAELLPMSSQPPVTKTELPIVNTSVMATTNAETKMQQNTITFSSIRPATNLFAPTTTTTSISAPLALSTPASTTVSLFQKVDSVPTTTGSLFKKNDFMPTTTVSLFPQAESTTTASTPLGNTQPVFSFGNQGPQGSVQAEKPKFVFSFGSNTTESSPMFKPTFGVSTDNNSSTNNTLSSGNSLTTSQAPSIFGATPVQKENMWSTNNVMFASNTTTNTVPKPPTFTFGTATPTFNASNGAFGSTSQPTQNVFGIAQQTTNPPSMFTNQLQHQTTPNIFGSPQPPNNSMMAMFGTPNANVTPAFGTPNQMPTFETPALNPAPAPTFNFGGQQPTGIFGFGQQNQAPSQVEVQQPPQVPQPGGIYPFGQPGVSPQLQFNMGSAPNPAGRRVRKAMRRTQR